MVSVISALKIVKCKLCLLGLSQSPRNQFVLGFGSLPHRLYMICPFSPHLFRGYFCGVQAGFQKTSRKCVGRNILGKEKIFEVTQFSNSDLTDLGGNYFIFLKLCHRHDSKGKRVYFACRSPEFGPWHHMLSGMPLEWTPEHQAGSSPEQCLVWIQNKTKKQLNRK